MLQTSESETEILLGNKQLLGIFLVVAVLLGVSFTGGFFMGRGAAGRGASVRGEMDKKAALDPAVSADPSLSGAGGQTHTIQADPNLPAAASGGADAEAAVSPSRSSADTTESGRLAEPALGSPKRPAVKTLLAPARNSSSEPTKSVDLESGYLPQSGTQYLQVAAVGREEAEAVADVLHRKGFHAHAVPKPGDVKLYRVIIGPVKDAGELSSTRDALRRTGFREVIVQRY